VAFMTAAGFLGERCAVDGCRRHLAEGVVLRERRSPSDDMGRGLPVAGSVGRPLRGPLRAQRLKGPDFSVRNANECELVHTHGNLGGDNTR
jgi:hypothetical protein